MESFIAEPFLQMPAACLSCIHYQHKGFDHDSHCPFGSDEIGRPHTRTHYGTCSKHRCEVFGTQICNGYECDPQILSFPVANRPEPRTPIQERLL